MASKEYAKIANAVYGLIEFFPEDELLKQKTKEKVLEILENLTLVFLLDNPVQSIGQKARAAQQALKDIEVLKSYLALGKERGWLSAMNLLILFKEYDQIKEEIRPIADLFLSNDTKREKPLKQAQISQSTTPVDNSVSKVAATSDVASLSERQTKILDILKNQGKAQVSDLKKALVNVSKRTLRRDIDELLKMGKVERQGEFNQVFYKIYNQALPAEEISPNSFNGGGTSEMS